MNGEILSIQQMRRIEDEAIRLGEATGPGLMQAAAQSVVDAMLAEWPELDTADSSAVVLCGPGLNGGDGYLIAALLSGRGWDVWVVPVGNHDAMPPDAAAARAAWLARGGEIALPDPDDPPIEERADVHESFQESAVAGASVVIDAMLGTGGSRELPAGWADFLAFAREQDHRIVAVDGHSGLNLATGRSRLPASTWRCAADLTVTFHALKPGHVIAEGPILSGKIVVGDIGLFNMQRRLEHSPGRLIPLSRKVDGAVKAAFKSAGHKYKHGHLLVLSGARGHEGAAMLAATAALRTGAGLVTLGRSEDAGRGLLGRLALMQEEVDSECDLAALLADDRINCVCLGPGLGVDRAARLLPGVLDGMVKRAILYRKGTYRTAVLDADALTAISRDPRRLMPMLGDNCVLTPHDGEFARLFPDITDRLSDRQRNYSKIDAARDAAARCGAVVLLKGPDTVIAAPDGQARIHSAYDVPWLATAGAGDVLAGIIAGLLARGFPPLDAAAAGAFLHAAAARRFGPGLIADDLPDQLPGVFRDMGA